MHLLEREETGEQEQGEHHQPQGGAPGPQRTRLPGSGVERRLGPGPGFDRSEYLEAQRALRKPWAGELSRVS